MSSRPKKSAPHESLSERERRRLLAWNRTERPFAANRCIHALIEEQARKTPDATAVALGNLRFSYRELTERASRLAHHLRALGVGRETLVLVCARRSLDIAVAILGVLKAGAAYVPVDPSCPPDRLSTILSEAQPRAVLTQAHLAGRFSAVSERVILLDGDWRCEAGKYKFPGEATPDDLAYVIFTSGSTGKPKGVLIPHRAVVNHATEMARLYELSPRDRVLQFASLSFDVAAEEIFPAWLTGAVVVLWPETSGAMPVPSFLKFVERQAITVLNLPAPYWEEWVNELERLGVPGCVRLVITGSDKVSPEKYSIWRRLVGSRVRWCNAYGPTETTITATIFQPPDPFGSDNVDCVPIGRPIANTQAWVLDHNLNLLPIGSPGELHIGGVGLARGYLNMPELTAEKFIRDPFSSKADARLYRTGDLARYLPDGNLEFLGRIDHQVKLRGYRIELGEIEAAMRQHPGVGRAVVLLQEDAPGEKKLAAYFVPGGTPAPSPEELRLFLQNRLPPYMVPSALVSMDRLPLTPGGKVDRGKLPAVFHKETQEDFVAPRDRLEMKLAEIWEKVLGVKPVGLKDNFFSLGGHSLLVLRLIAQVERTFDINLPLASLIQAPTIEQLAPLVRQKREPHGSESLLFSCQAEGSKPPLFSYGGTVQLARYLDPDQPLYLLELHGLDGRRAPETIEEMAREGLEEIRAVQPRGPYFLSGYSFGGLAMFEIAQQLTRQGEQIALLVLIDPSAPKDPASPPDGAFRAPLPLREKYAFHSRALAGLGLREAYRYVLARARERVQWTKLRSLRIACETCFRLGYFLPPSLRMEYFMQITAEAIERYTPRPFSGPFIVLNGSESAVWDWRKLAADTVEFDEIQVEHLEIMKEPYVQVLAGKLKKYLERAQIAVFEKSWVS